MTSASTEIDSLPKLIERLRDPHCDSYLPLDAASLNSIVKYDGVDDFAETFTDFLDAIKANNTITKVDIRIPLPSDVDKKNVYPIINPLLRHLPRANTVEFDVLSSSPIERFLFKDAASFTNVRIYDCAGEPDNERVLELHPDLEVFEYVNPSLPCVNSTIGRVLVSLPFPSKLRQLGFTDDAHVRGFRWDDEMARPFTEPELNRLVEIVQVSSLMKVTLQNIRLSSMEECSQLARGFATSPVKDLRLVLFSPDAGNYRDVVSALSEMPHLESLDAAFALDRWLRDEETAGSFSIRVGDIIRGAPGLKSLRIDQGWKPLNDLQCHDLAMAIQSPSCGLKAFDISDGFYKAYTGRGETTIARAAIIMSALSSLEKFAVDLAIDEKDDFDVWLSALPRMTALRSLRMKVEHSFPALTESQQERFLGILSGWFYLTDVDEPAFVFDCLSEDRGLQVETLLRLNKAGRHYLALPTRSKADGVEVLVRVRDELNDIYTHLLENPCLCDRSVDPPAPRRSAPTRKKARRG